MSGPIVDFPIRKCPACPAVYLEDAQMYEDTNICPACGSAMEPPAPAGETGDEIYGNESGIY